MARSASSKRSSAKKKPAKSKIKKRTAASRKAAKSGKRSGAPRGAKAAKGAKGKPRTASTRAKGAGKAPKRSPKASTKRAGKAEAAQQTQAAAESGGTESPGASSPRIEVRNVNVPGYRTTVDAGKYASMRDTMFGFLPRAPPGMTQTEMMEAARTKADRAVFPGGEKTEWWMKTVQLDQEARGAMKRSDTKPLRWWRT